MNIDMTRYHGRPAEKRSPQEETIYDKLDALGIVFDRVDHDHADTMDDCLLIEKTLGAPICKNLFLCNRQETDFYLLMMPGGKPFKTKYLSAHLDCARLSFASETHMAELLHTIPGSVSALELLFDTEKRVRLIMDSELLQEETVSGHPGFSTSTVRLSRADFLRYAEAVGHVPTVVTLPRDPE